MASGSGEGRVGLDEAGVEEVRRIMYVASDCSGRAGCRSQPSMAWFIKGACRPREVALRSQRDRRTDGQGDRKVHF